MAERVRRSIEEMKEGRARLLRAAEGLFARSGIDGASLREIATAAGQRNHNAVRYHFGSREGLVQEIFSARMWQMEAFREKMLGDADRQGRLADVRALIEIIFLPQLLLDDTGDSHSYAGFLSQFLLRNSSREFGDFGAELPPHLHRTLTLLRARLDFLDDDAAQRRLLTACFMFLNMLAGRSRAEDGERFDAALDDTLDQIVAALCLPMTDRRQDPPPKTVRAGGDPARPDDSRTNLVQARRG